MGAGGLWNAMGLAILFDLSAEAGMLAGSSSWVAAHSKLFTNAHTRSWLAQLARQARSPSSLAKLACNARS